MPVHPVDIITLLLGVFFFVRGFQKGLIVEITTIVALVMGIIAAMQLAGIVSQYMAEVIGKAKWVFYAGYLLSFLLVFFAVQLLGKGVEQALQATQLNFINRILGGIGGLFKVVFLASLVFWLLDQAESLGRDFKSDVYAYHFTEPVAPWVINQATAYFPILKDLIANAEDFFKELNQNLQERTSEAR